jgi:hypothetical protein
MTPDEGAFLFNCDNTLLDNHGVQADLRTHLEREFGWGPTVMLSDGDIVLHPRKLQRSGLWDAVEGRVLIYVHLDEAEMANYPRADITIECIGDLLREDCA